MGWFDVESGTVLASDPCYEFDPKDPSLQGELSHVKVGRWNARVRKAKVGDWGDRCLELIAFHEGARQQDVMWKPADAIIGVDSGQAGLFDVKYFREPAIVPDRFAPESELIDPTDIWYSLCCHKTLSDLGAGVIPYGVVSSSGLGDGGYELYSHETNGEIVGIRLVFISPEDLRELISDDASVSP